jgi:GTP-binding protein
VHAQFIISAASVSDFPRTGVPEIAFVGRSNVGKSSLINALVRKSIARTSAAPGKTRLANFYLVEPGVKSEALYLVDLPGYGYARGGDEAAREFETLASQYFDRVPTPQRSLAGVLHLIDSRHPELPQDLAAHKWVTQSGLPVAIVATKIDKLKQAEKARILQCLADQYDTAIIATSSVDGGGTKEIWKLLREWTRHDR